MTPTGGPVLAIRNLDVTYPGGAWAVRGVDLEVGEGEVLALVGESGSGKTTIARAVIGIGDPETSVTGSISIRGTELVGASRRTRGRISGAVVGYVAQDPYASYNPLHTVRRHVREAWLARRQRPDDEAIIDSLARLGIDNASSAASQYPHQWSGGMLQRATIVAANAHHPPLIVADEPTTALDAELADRVLTDLRATGAAVLLISHSLGTVRAHADRIAVCYAGRIVEEGPTASVLDDPEHPYTTALLAATPKRGHGLPQGLPGTPPSPRDRRSGCPFAGRCPEVVDECHHERPVVRDRVACWQR